jgi:Transposase IS66 family
VRDGYSGYQHLERIEHAWRGIHLFRDLRSVNDPDPHGQSWAAMMVRTLLIANNLAHQARAQGLRPERMRTRNCAPVSRTCAKNAPPSNARSARSRVRPGSAAMSSRRTSPCAIADIARREYPAAPTAPRGYRTAA